MSGELLRRELGMAGAVMLGLGAMIGTGVFVSLGLGAGIAGPAVLLALVAAAGIALCNGLSSAQLAARHPVSGGTYEYGYIYLGSRAGFTAGWVFLIAKAASAATAALGFAGYLLHALGLSADLRVPVALASIAALAAVVLAGLRRSNIVNIAIVTVTLLSLAWFVAAGLPEVRVANFVPFFESQVFVGGGGAGAIGAWLEATALMFVAYTGYARIATLGEEVREPATTIPRAIVLTALLVMAIYLAVAAIGIGVAGAGGLAAATLAEAAPLAIVAASFAVPFSSDVLIVGALTAMLGVALNLILGLSRVALAMARRGDLPSVFARIDRAGSTPYWSVVGVACLTGLLVTIGDVRTTWSFSAFAVLVYYALTNLAALRMDTEERMFPPWVALTGLACCLGLAFWVETAVWLIGLALIAAGLGWHEVRRRNPGVAS